MVRDQAAIGTDSSACMRSKWLRQEITGIGHLADVSGFLWAHAG
jgi:hypothetical protein